MRTILALARKELTQVFRDRILTVQVLLAPLLQLLVFSNVASFEVREVRVAIVDRDRSPVSARVVSAFEASGRFRTVLVTDADAVADRALLTRDVSMVLRLPRGLARDLARTGAGPVQVVLNAEDGASAAVVRGYAARILDGVARDVAVASPSAAPGGIAPASLVPARIDVRVRTRSNPEGRYVGQMAAGLLALLMTLVGTLMTAQTIAREREIGTIEQLNATPITRTEFVVGKLLPFWGLGLVTFTVGLVLMRVVLGIELAGSPVVAALGAAVYLVAALGLGLLISTVVETQQQAMFVVFFVFVVLLFLSGLYTPTTSMPRWAQALAEANPITHVIRLFRAVLLRGATLADVARELAILAAFAAGLLGLAIVRYRKTAA